MKRNKKDRPDAEKKLTMEQALKISAEVRKMGGEVEQRLKDKCLWEQRCRTAIIVDYGDPRNWK